MTATVELYKSLYKKLYKKPYYLINKCIQPRHAVADIARQTPSSNALNPAILLPRSAGECYRLRALLHWSGLSS